MLLVFDRYRCEATGGIVTVANDNRLRQFSDNGSNRQRFARSGTSGKVEIFSRMISANWVVDALGGDLTTPGFLQMYPVHHGDNQKWKLNNEGLSESGYELFSIYADDSEMVWDVPNGSLMNGIPIIYSNYHGDKNQLWKIDAYTLNAAVVKSVHNDFVMDVPGFSTDEMYIQHYPANGGFNQNWEFEGYIDSGPVKIRSVSSGMYMTDWKLPGHARSSVFQTWVTGGDNQNWVFDNVDGNIYTIASVNTGYYLSIPPGHTGPTRIIGLPATGGNDQRWHVIV